MNNEQAIPEAKRTWRELDRTERRVAGVLVEKSKTTQDNYPMTLNSITTACNQKSNRYPLMNLSPEEVQKALDRLRQCRAVMEVHGDGRVPKYKHLLYEWLGVEKLELAVMAELLLRGQQTLGDLRARASRMDEIASQDELRPVVDGLIRKDLIVELTPPGRGQMVTHNLYHFEELKKVRLQVASELATSEEPKSESPGEANSLASRVESLEAKLAEALVRIEQLESALR
ncbi:MAG: DUF480 domain-containing protein [Pirellulaceae bacterium]|jgi:uncharacterized protein YceH (UPF0502 family)